VQQSALRLRGLAAPAVARKQACAGRIA